MNTTNLIGMMGMMRKSSGIGLFTALLCAVPASACPPDEAGCEATKAATARTVTLRAGDDTRNVILTGADDEHANVWVTAGGGAVDDDVRANVWVTGPGSAVDDDLLGSGDAKTMEISLADGKVTVRINGKEVPAARIHHEKGQIVILDEDGKEIETIRVGGSGHEMRDATGNMPFGMGGVGQEQDSMFGLVEMEEPKVMLGILLDEPGPALRQHFDLKPGTTTMISALYKGLPAHAAGLDQYDVIVEIEGASPADPASLRAALADRETGDVIELTVVHHGRTKRVEIALEAFDRGAMTEAEMIGEAPRATMQFDRFFQDGAQGFDVTIPEMKDLRFGPGEGRQRIFVTPKQDVFELAPASPRPPQGWVERDGTGEEVLDERLQRLDRRLAELEEMLDALLERASDRSNTKKGGTR